MKQPLLDKLKQSIVLGDGGYLLALENRGYVQAGPFTPEVTIEHPNALRALHQEFVHAGAEVLQVLAFYASENKLAQIGFGNTEFDVFLQHGQPAAHIVDLGNAVGNDAQRVGTKFGIIVMLRKIFHCQRQSRCQVLEIVHEERRYGLEGFHFSRFPKAIR